MVQLSLPGVTANAAVMDPLLAAEGPVFVSGRPHRGGRHALRLLFPSHGEGPEWCGRRESSQRVPFPAAGRDRV